MKIVKENTVAEVVSNKIGADHIFSKYNIDYYCGGWKTLEAVCLEIGISFEDILQQIETTNAKLSSTSKVISESSINALQKISDEYHITLEKKLSHIVFISNKVALVHSEIHSELFEINSLVQSMQPVFKELVNNFQSSLFGKITAMEELKESKRLVPANNLELLKKAIIRFEIGQHLIINSLQEISIISNQYKLPEGACLSFKQLYEELKEWEVYFLEYTSYSMNEVILKTLKESN